MIDSKQFIIGKNMSHLPENWQTIQLGNGFQLCYQQELRIWHSDDGRVVLLGHAWQTDPCRGTPEDEIGSVVIYFNKPLESETEDFVVVECPKNLHVEQNLLHFG